MKPPVPCRPPRWHETGKFARTATKAWSVAYAEPDPAFSVDKLKESLGITSHFKLARTAGSRSEEDPVTIVNVSVVKAELFSESFGKTKSS